MPASFSRVSKFSGDAPTFPIVDDGVGIKSTERTHRSSLHDAPRVAAPDTGDYRALRYPGQPAMLLKDLEHLARCSRVADYCGTALVHVWEGYHGLGPLAQQPVAHPLRQAQLGRGPAGPVQPKGLRR